MSKELAPITDRDVHDGRTLAEFSDYAGFHAAMIARARERQIAIGSDNAAYVSGLPSNYLAKLLAPKPTRRVGMISLAPVLAVLGVRLAMLEDKESISRLAARLKKRNEACVHTGAVHVVLSKRFLRKIGAKGGANSRKNLGKRKRRALARKAALARWAEIAT